jgi:hypothetical protein
MKLGLIIASAGLQIEAGWPPARLLTAKFYASLEDICRLLQASKIYVCQPPYICRPAQASIGFEDICRLQRYVGRPDRPGTPFLIAIF